MQQAVICRSLLDVSEKNLYPKGGILRKVSSVFISLIQSTPLKGLCFGNTENRANFPLPASPIQKECAEDLDMIWIKMIMSLPALNSRKQSTPSSSAVPGNICFYSSLNTRLFSKSPEADRSLRFLKLSQQSSMLSRHFRHSCMPSKIVSCPPEF